MNTLCIALALGPIYMETKGEKTLVTPLDGSIARLETLLRWLTPDPEILITATAGYSKERLQTGVPLTSLAEQMAHYISINHYKWINCLVAKPLVWGTRQEIVAGIHLATRQEFTDVNTPTIVRVASNRHHLLRCRLYLKHYMPKTWRAELIVAHHKFSARDHAYEIGKLARDLWRLHVKHGFPTVPNLT